MRGKILKVTLAIVILGVGSLSVYRLFFLRMVRVPTGSMANTIIPGDHLVVKKIVGTVERGNLILFKWPKDPSIQYVSRVVGLPGDTIEVRNRIVYIDGKELQEKRVIVKPEDHNEAPGALQELSSEGTGPYRVFYHSRDGSDASRIPADPEGSYGINGPFQIPDNQYFVMADNRDNSLDSSFWGTVTREAIGGKPNMIYWSSKSDQSGNEHVRWERIFTKVR